MATIKNLVGLGNNFIKYSELINFLMFQGSSLFAIVGLFVQLRVSVQTKMTLRKPFWQMQSKRIAVCAVLDHVIKVCIIVDSKSLIDYLVTLLDGLLPNIKI